jgi:hypothetical protein
MAGDAPKVYLNDGDPPHLSEDICAVMRSPSPRAALRISRELSSGDAPIPIAHPLLNKYIDPAGREQHVLKWFPPGTAIGMRIDEILTEQAHKLSPSSHFSMARCRLRGDGCGNPFSLSMTPLG